MTIRLRVYGDPAPQGSKVRTRWGMREASLKVQPWREAILSQALRDGVNGILLDGPVHVRAAFLFPRPQSHFGTRKGERYLKDTAPVYKTSDPDLDKLQRSTGDALALAGILRDDNLIVRWTTEKRYVREDDPQPGAVIEIISL